MKMLLKPLLLCMAYWVIATSASFSQTIRLRDAPENIRPYLFETKIYGVTLYLLRVPRDRITGMGMAAILSMQEELDRCLGAYRAGKRIDDYNIEFRLRSTKGQRKDWPMEYWEKEVQAYNAYGKVMDKRWRDSLEIVWKRAEDSARFAEQVAGYYFISRPVVLLKQRAAEPAMTMGKLYLGSYVQLLDSVEGTGIIKIYVAGNTGYIYWDDVVDSITKLKATKEEMALFRKQRYYKYEESEGYRARLDYEESRAANASSTPGANTTSSRAGSRGTKRVYHREPQGGCYYIDSHGNKVYVDRSLCN